VIKKPLSNNFSEDKYILGLQSYASHDPGACIVKFNLKKKCGCFQRKLMKAMGIIFDVK
jgi:hypothetical protein